MAPNIDSFNRGITYLRISVTDRCNLGCFYCLPMRSLRLRTHNDILRYEEILAITEIATELGIRKVRLTGGEPLVRKGFVSLVCSMARLKGIEDLSITTNGVLLKQMAQDIFDAGVHRINVSLDTLDPIRYAKISGHDHFDLVWQGIEQADAVGFSPIKINVVAIRGMNDDDFLAFAKLSIKTRFHVRFIEYMPIGHGNNWTREKHVSAEEIRSVIETLGPLHRIPNSGLAGPAERYRFEGAKGEVGFISAMSHQFCCSCNRLRLTSDGKLRPCLLGDIEVDVKTPLRAGCSKDEVKAVFREAIARKPKEHNAAAGSVQSSVRPMSAIGG